MYVYITKYLRPKNTILQTYILLVPNFDINERYLYHGTNGDKDVYREEQLDDRLSQPGHFGTGIYFRYVASSLDQNHRMKRMQFYTVYIYDRMIVYSVFTLSPEVAKQKQGIRIQ